MAVTLQSSGKFRRKFDMTKGRCGILLGPRSTITAPDIPYAHPLGVDGIDPEAGITTHYEPEAMLNRTMCTRADQVIAVTDSSKFGKRALYNVLPLKSIDVLVTDKNMPAEFVESLVALGIDVITV